MDTAVKLTPRQETLLVFLGSDGEQRLDPIRIQKGLFLLTMETPEEWLPLEARYNFEPYNYGPYSAEIYQDLDQLVRYGYVEDIEIPGRSWKYYALTPMGLEMVQHVIEATDSRMAEYAARLREYVRKLSFSKLLTRVYERYPDYAVNSVFRR